MNEDKPKNLVEHITKIMQYTWVKFIVIIFPIWFPVFAAYTADFMIETFHSENLETFFLLLLAFLSINVISIIYNKKYPVISIMAIIVYAVIASIIIFFLGWAALAHLGYH